MADEGTVVGMNLAGDVDAASEAGVGVVWVAGVALAFGVAAFCVSVFGACVYRGPYCDGWFFITLLRGGGPLAEIGRDDEKKRVVAEADCVCEQDSRNRRTVSM